MVVLPARRMWGVVIVGAVIAVGVLIASSAAGALRQSIALSLSSGILNPAFLLMLIPFAAWSYGLRVVRWHTLVRRLVPGLPLRVSGYSQIVGFTFSATPGRVAELYKLKLLEQATRLPVAQSLPAAIVERLTDIAAFGLLMVIGGLFNWPGASTGNQVSRWIAIGAIVALLAVAYPVGRRVGWARLSRPFATFWAGGGAGRVRGLPVVGRIPAILSQVRIGGAKVTNPYTLALALTCVVVGRLGDGVVLWQIAQAVGYPVSFTMALLMIGSAGLVGGITLSPGGLGAAEATLVGLIVAHGAPLGAAMVTAFGARALIFWLWVAIGLLVFLISHGQQVVGWTGLWTSREVRAQPRDGELSPGEERL